MFKDEPWFDDYLRNAYCTERKTMAQIGKELSCSPASILAHLRRLDIETRNVSDYPFSEERREIARRNGQKAKGRKVSESAKEAIRLTKKKKWISAGHEFGGHEKKRKDGYIAVYFPDHPRSSKSGYVMKHILVIEKEIGRHLNPDECVHHINRVKDDNRVENLQLMTKHDHMSMHNKMRYAERNKEVLNVWNGTGRMVADPTIRQTQSGKSVANFTLAVDRDHDREQTDFIDVVAWNGTAEFVSKYFHKGSMTTVNGRLQMRKYEAKDGSMRTAYEIVANSVYFGDSKKGD